MLFLSSHGYRTIATTAGHGRSEQTWGGNEMDTYADDLATLTELLDVKKRYMLVIRRAAGKWRAISGGTVQAELPRPC